MERKPDMHPTLMQEIARYRQADMLREADRARLAHEVSIASDRPRRRLRLPRFGFAGHRGPAFGR
jgi:hypothetical protein